MRQHWSLAVVLATGMTNISMDKDSETDPCDMDVTAVLIFLIH